MACTSSTDYRSAALEARRLPCWPPRLGHGCLALAWCKRGDRATRQDDARRSRRVPLNGQLTNRRAWSQPPNDLPGQGGPLSTCQPPWQHLGARNHGRGCRFTTALLIPATASGPCCCSAPAHGFRKHAVSAMGGLCKASEHGRTVARSTGTGRLLAVLGSCRSGGHEGRRRPWCSH